MPLRSESPPGSLPPLPQEEAEALVELQGQLQEAQEATDALRVQVSAGPGLGRGRRGEGHV